MYVVGLLLLLQSLKEKMGACAAMRKNTRWKTSDLHTKVKEPKTRGRPCSLAGICSGAHLREATKARLLLRHAHPSVHCKWILGYWEGLKEQRGGCLYVTNMLLVSMRFTYFMDTRLHKSNQLRLENCTTSPEQFTPEGQQQPALPRKPA